MRYKCHKMKKVLLIGTHPIIENIKEQYETLGYYIEAADGFEVFHGPRDFQELCVLPEYNLADSYTLQALESFAADFSETLGSQSKPVCHLLLHNQVTLWLLQTLDLYPEIHRKFELYAFTMEDQWAKNLFCGLGRSEVSYPPLDWEKIDTASNKNVHLVIAGFSEMGESLALNAALIAHFPNYVRNPQLRTRITIIDSNLAAKRDAFIQRNSTLFDHSYYRTIDIAQHRMTQYHEPIYHTSRENFIDVEWEFVDGNFYDPIIQHKLRLWSDSPEQLLTLVLCDADCQTNFGRAFALPKSFSPNHIPVLVYAKQAELLNQVRQCEGFHNLYPFGMDNSGYDVRLPLLQMAKRLNYFYTCSFGHKVIPTDMPLDEIEKAWRELSSFSMRYSNIFNVMTIATKMRSLGHKEEDWDKFYALTQEEVEQLSAVEHNRWSVDRLLLGFRPPTDTEREEIRNNIEAFINAQKTGGRTPDQDLKNVYKKQKVHYDLCSYRELGKDKTGQDVRVYDFDLTACIPLIAQSFKEALS